MCEGKRSSCCAGHVCWAAPAEWEERLGAKLGRAAACSSARTQRDAIVVCAPVIKATEQRPEASCTHARSQRGAPRNFWEHLLPLEKSFVQDAGRNRAQQLSLAPAGKCRALRRPLIALVDTNSDTTGD